MIDRVLSKEIEIRGMAVVLRQLDDNDAKKLLSRKDRVTLNSLIHGRRICTDTETVLLTLQDMFNRVSVINKIDAFTRSKAKPCILTPSQKCSKSETKSIIKSITKSRTRTKACTDTKKNIEIDTDAEADIEIETDTKSKIRANAKAEKKCNKKIVKNVKACIEESYKECVEKSYKECVEKSYKECVEKSYKKCVEKSYNACTRIDITDSIANAEFEVCERTSSTIEAKKKSRSKRRFGLRTRHVKSTCQTSDL